MFQHLGDALACFTGVLPGGKLIKVGVKPWDPVILTLATVIPARRAASVEPLAALRSEG